MIKEDSMLQKILETSEYVIKNSEDVKNRGEKEND